MFSTEDCQKELDEINNAQRDCVAMSLNPPWKRLTATEVTRKGLHYQTIIQDDVEQAPALTEKTWRKWLKDIFYMDYRTFSEKRFLPGQVIYEDEIKPFPKIRFQETPEYWDERKKDIAREHALDIERQVILGDSWDKWNEYYGSLGEWTWFDGLRAFVYKIIKYFTRRPKMRAKLRTEVKNLVYNEFNRLMTQHNEDMHNDIDSFRIEYESNYEKTDLHTLIYKLLGHLGITLKVTPEKTELVSVTKKRKRSRKVRSSVDKSKKKAKRK